MFKKVDLVKKVATKNEVSKEVATKQVNSVIDSVIEMIYDEEQDGIDLTGFAKFQVLEKPERQGRNPKTGEKVVTPAHFECKVTLSKKIKKLQ